MTVEGALWERKGVQVGWDEVETVMGKVQLKNVIYVFETVGE